MPNRTDEDRVSDHALVRWIERAHGIDMSALRAQMLANGVREAVDAGATQVRISGFTFACRNQRIIAVIGGQKTGKLRRELQR